MGNQKRVRWANLVKRSAVSQALKLVLDVRLERKKVYGDSFMSTSDWELLALIKQKAGRLEDFVIRRAKEDLYEDRVDALIDLVNYALFLLENEVTRK